VAVTRRVVTRCRIYPTVMDGRARAERAKSRGRCAAFRPQFFHVRNERRTLTLNTTHKLCHILLMGPPNPPPIGALSVSHHPPLYHHFQMGFWNDLVCLGLPEATSAQKKSRFWIKTSKKLLWNNDELDDNGCVVEITEKPLQMVYYRGCAFIASKKAQHSVESSHSQRRSSCSCPNCRSTFYMEFTLFRRDSPSSLPSKRCRHDRIEGFLMTLDLYINVQSKP
jgi:hypothetical protein